jgi:hypothetical protein
MSERQQPAMLALVDLLVDDLVRDYLTAKPAPEREEAAACAKRDPLQPVDKAA